MLPSGAGALIARTCCTRCGRAVMAACHDGPRFMLNLYLVWCTCMDVQSLVVIRVGPAELSMKKEALWHACDTSTVCDAQSRPWTLHFCRLGVKSEGAAGRKLRRGCWRSTWLQPSRA